MITPEVSEVIVPAAALKPVLLLPAITVTLPGTLISGELELSEIVVFTVTVCGRVTVQVVVPADIKPGRLQAREVTCTDGTRVIETDWEEPL